MEKKILTKKSKIFTLFLIILLFTTSLIFAGDIGDIEAPTGMRAFITVLPLIVILALLFMRFHMLIAGLIGGAMAMIIGGISLGEANGFFLKAIPDMLSITVPIINSAIAMAVFKAGSYNTSLSLVRRAIKGRVEFFAVFIVVLQAAATYMSGVGGGSAMVIAPLAFAALGAIPELIAGMALAAAVSFTTSPASLETGVVSKLAGIEVQNYVQTMRPYWLGFVLIAIGIAYYGAKKRGAIFKGEEAEEYKEMSKKELWLNTIPAIFLLFAVIIGPIINKAIGIPILAPLFYTIITVALIGIFTKLTMSESVKSLVDGSQYILVRLFGVGIFLGFINMIGDTGAFAVIAGIAEKVPPAFTVPAAVLSGFLIGVPAGAYVGSILALVLPVAIALNFSPLALGFTVMGVGLGSQVSFVNITMQALSSGFQIPIIDVVKGNAKWIGACTVILIILSFIFS